MLHGKKFLALPVVLCLLMGSVLLPLQAEASGAIPIDKLLTTLSKTPVASSPVDEITAATSTPGCYISAYAWYNVYGQPISGNFSQDAATVQLQVNAAPGYAFSPGVTAYLNNEWVEHNVAADGSYVILYRTYAPAVWAPAIIKHPGGETVNEGDWTSFVATASNVESCYWRLVDAKGEAYQCESLPRVFPGVTVDETMGKLKLYHIPRELDGAKISCVFTGPGGSIETQAAILKVRYEQTEETPEPAPEVTEMPEATEEPKPAETEAPEELPQEEVHVHSFDGWQMDESNHWKSCSCGEISEKGEHSFQWTVVQEASKKQEGKSQGKCSVCGCVQWQTLPVIEIETPGWFLFGGIGIAAFLILLAIVSASIRKRRRRRRRSRRR